MITENEKINGYSETDLKEIFNKYKDQENWKKPFNAIIISEEDKNKLETAIMFYHGSQPITVPIEVIVTPHKEALVKMVANGYKIESVGYDCY